MLNRINERPAEVTTQWHTSYAFEIRNNNHLDKQNTREEKIQTKSQRKKFV